MATRYDWDENKRLSNLARHGLDFRAAWRVYEHPDKITLVSPYSHEARLIDMAEVNGDIWYLVYTVRDETIRYISFRPAHRKERRIYYDQLQNR